MNKISNFNVGFQLIVKGAIDEWTSIVHPVLKDLIDSNGILPKDLDFDTEEFCDILGYFCEYEVYPTRIVFGNRNEIQF